MPHGFGRTSPCTSIKCLIFFLYSGPSEILYSGRGLTNAEVNARAVSIFRKFSFIGFKFCKYFLFLKIPFPYHFNTSRGLLFLSLTLCMLASCHVFLWFADFFQN